MLKKLPMALVALPFIYGCSAPDNIQPTAQFNTSAIEQSESLQNRLSAVEWPVTRWWEQYQDPQLNRLIEQAVSDNPDMSLADARLKQASAFVAQADAQFDPIVEADASIRRARLSKIEDYSYQGNQIGTSRSLGLSASYSFDLWGGKKAAWEASVDSLHAAEVEHQAAVISLSGAVAKTYVQLASAYALEDLARKDLERNQRIEDITQRLLDNGLTSEDRLYAAQSSAAAAQQTLKTRTLAVVRIANALAALLGAGPDAAQSVQRPAITVNSDIVIPANLPAELIGRRPDITAAKWRVEAADKQITVAKTRFYPNFNLSAMAGFKALLGDAMFEDSSRSWNVTPAVSLPLFRSGLKADLLNSTAGYDMAVAQYNKTLIQALNNVADNILTLQSVELQLTDAKRSMELAEKSYHITEQRYQTGMGSQLETLMAEQQLLMTESMYTQLKNQQQETQVLLIQSLGGGFQNAPEVKPSLKVNQ